MKDIEEQPYDNRHSNEPPMLTQPAPPLFGLGNVEPFTPRPTYVSTHEGTPMAHAATGLVWRFQPGMELQDIGRTFGEPDALADMHEVDLRSILAHLDSAARSITRELEARGLGGRR